MINNDMTTVNSTKILPSNIDGNLQQKSFACLFLLITCNWKHYVLTAVATLQINSAKHTVNHFTE